MKHLAIYVSLSVFLLTLTAGCAPYPVESIPQNTPSLSPKQVVQYYYESLNQQDIKDAQQFMSPKLISFYRSTAYGLNNIKSVSNIKISQAPASSGASVDTGIVQVTASFSAKYYHVGGTTNGPQTRFLYLSRNSSNQPWLIESIGSGP